MHSTVVCFTSADGERDIISADDLFEEIRHVADYTMPIADDDMYAIAKSMMGKITKDIVQNNDKTVTVKFDMGKIQELLENEITRYKNLVDGFSLDEYKEDWILLYRLKNACSTRMTQCSGMSTMGIL